MKWRSDPGTYLDNLNNRPLSVNSQSGGQNNKIVLHLKGLFLSGERKTIVLSSRLGITEMGLLSFIALSTG